MKLSAALFCVATDDGQKIHKHLDAAMKANQEVVLSFHNVTALTTPFLTAAIGELYDTFSEEKIHALLKVEDIAPDDLAFLESVVRDVKLYFEDPQRFNQIFQEVLEDDDDEA